MGERSLSDAEKAELEMEEKRRKLEEKFHFTIQKKTSGKPNVKLRF